MKKITFILLALTIAFSNCIKEPTPTPIIIPIPKPCTFSYSYWTYCSSDNNIQTREYQIQTGPETCTPPADSIKRFCPFSIGQPVTDIDGNIYKTVIIGTQTWTAENLNVSRFKNGEAISYLNATPWYCLAWDAWCYYDNNPTNGSIYGKLYNWYAVNDPRGLAPTGYHIPTKEEFMTLINYLGGEQVAGQKMKANFNWPYEDAGYHGNNNSGFTGFPAGRTNGNGFSGSGTNKPLNKPFLTYFWTFSEIDNDKAQAIGLYQGGSIDKRIEMKYVGYSIRCIKD